jgi:hypothetical protein
MEQMMFAYRDFRQSKQDPACFVVETYRQDGLYLVNFLPASNFREDGDNFKITLGGANSCGRGISYEFDAEGKFVRKIYQR